MSVTELAAGAIATTAHIVADHLVFVVVDGDVFRVGHVDPRGRVELSPEPCASPTLATAAEGYGYVVSGGDVEVVHLSAGRRFRLAGPADSVSLSADLGWAAVGGTSGTEVRSVRDDVSRRQVAGRVLSVSWDGRTVLTLDEAAAVLRDSSDGGGPSTFRGAVDVDHETFAFFDSLGGAACVRMDRRSRARDVQWMPGRWVVGVSRVNDAILVGLQRLGHLERIRFGKAEPRDIPHSQAVDAGPRFTLEWARSTDDVRVPMSRFQGAAERRSRSIVTVHGGFGLSLRPVSGISDRPDDLDMLFAHVRGGGELGIGWALAGRGQHKQQALDDLGAIVHHEFARDRTVSLMGTSHGGWLALLCALEHPSLIDRVCVTSPITHLSAYLRSRLGRKHRAEFPPENLLDHFDPMTRIVGASSVVPDLMIVHGAADTTVPNQDPEAFAAAWRSAGGRCRIVRHSGGHYGPPDGEAPHIVREQRSFLGVVA